MLIWKIHHFHHFWLQILVIFGDFLGDLRSDNDVSCGTRAKVSTDQSVTTTGHIELLGRPYLIFRSASHFGWRMGRWVAELLKKAKLLKFSKNPDYSQNYPFISSIVVSVTFTTDVHW